MNIEGSENESEFECLIRSSNFQTSFNIPSSEGDCVSVAMPNSVVIGQNFAEIWRFFELFKMEAMRHFRSAVCVFGRPVKCM